MSSDLYISDFVGVLGVVLVLIAYALLQMQKLRFDDLKYLLLNTCGACFLIVSLIFKFNPASFLIECCWLGISLYGLLRKLGGRTTD